MSTKTILVKDLVKKFNLEVNLSILGERQVIKPTLTRAGLALGGFLNTHDIKGSVIVWSTQEKKFFDTVGFDNIRGEIELIFKNEPALVIMASGMSDKHAEVIKQLANRYNIPYCKTWMNMASLHGSIGSYLLEEFAPSYQIHGTLVVIMGLGVMIMGDSGIGKSEAALELIQKGHQLVTDDAVIVSQIGEKIVGRAPRITKNFLEARGLGFIDIQSVYGYRAIVDDHDIDLVVKLTDFKENNDFDRLGNKNLHYQIYNAKIPLIEIPVKAGRSFASLVEAAANVQILRNQGVDPLDVIRERTISEPN
ncbi:HPr(Ser) kinase/phosphatase [Mycoplasmopsis agassizii]|uniref:HPr(Ser) kinase/phosphatase n=1 Tax=Mycoplasmopsis agassizii TaxID=33922 RepID=A0ABX4H4T9_9BACT|nr:HPr(Ser) kinase/phosphatase [Mycoplasmopsis agassizii]PAF54909.1 HPr(Ser) kinase/phosphatase [Mycoplasmopsis agassizii]SMC17203.1 Hpr(Ser) kinase/phosphatase [Mycoplasmopsis agassizii]